MRTSGAIGGINAATLAAKSVPSLFERTIDVPQQIRDVWQVARMPLDIGLTLDRTGAEATLPRSAKQIFSSFSNALDNPGRVYFVSPAGNDSTGTGAEAAPWRSIHKAVTQANSTGQSAKIIIDAGNYPRFANPSNGGVVSPTVDIAFLARGGWVTTGTFDEFSPLAADATYPECHSLTLSNVDRVFDLIECDRDGFHVQLRHVSTPALCARIPGSWTSAGGKVYVNRADGLQPTTANTRICRYSSGSWRFENPCNVYIGPMDSHSGFETHGGDGAGCLRFYAASPAADQKALVVEHGRFRYAGGAMTGSQGASSISIQNFHGLALLVDCDASRSSRDGISASNSSSDRATHLVTIGCTSSFVGNRLTQSCNALTLHDHCIGIDVAGRYSYSAGGCVRIVGSSKLLLSGTRVAHDRGDLWAGGSVRPTAVMAGNDSTIWMDAADLEMKASEGLVHATVDATVSRRRMPPSNALDGGTGTFSAW